MSLRTNARTAMLGVAALTILTTTALMPVTVSFDANGFSLKPAAAFAKDRNSNDTKKSERDNNDDKSSGDHNGSDDSGSHNNDSSNDDRNGSGGHNNDDRNDPRPLNLSSFLNSLQSGTSIVRADQSGNTIEIVYSDGWKEEISNGFYELKDPSNRTVVQRQASADDIARLSSAF